MSAYPMDIHGIPRDVYMSHGGLTANKGSHRMPMVDLLPNTVHKGSQCPIVDLLPNTVHKGGWPARLAFRGDIQTIVGKINVIVTLTTAPPPLSP